MTATLDPTALRTAVDRAMSGSAYLREKLGAAGMGPDRIGEPEDLAQLPFTTKEELRDTAPLDYAAVPAERIVRVHSSSGTTGRRTICAYTERDLADWAEMFARCYRFAGLTARDRVQIAVGYGLWTAGVGFQTAAERIGAMAVPTGPGNTEMQLEMMRELGTTALCATSSFALLIAELVDRRDLRPGLALRTVVTGSERWGEAMRARIESLLGVETFDVYGLTELWGPGTGIECGHHDGIHVWDDYYHMEIVDPETLEPLPPGAVGEIVVTTLTKEATPLIRYRTRDLSYLYPDPCPCGSRYPRIGRILGRSDDQIKVRGVAFLPMQVDTVLADLPDAGPEFQAHVHRQADGRDTLTVRVEAVDRPGLREELEHRLRARTGLRIEVDLVAPGTLPRSERKTRRVFDHREP
ncbi:phenylacetate--CoA ligase family protein [Actinophytocola xanthii]|uniref:Phenylacetate-coenzyme A ligase n=1 Tax=Actinophytocola xanthii TaxID=1912961 RepID=A0A1Q8CPR7_9PSEU|nr:phenylacetate--CoA ligase [Actinophytocola xanthii]OLF16354.1 phenylacetate--CoA ligase [Actinophytocola xanthii]